MQRFPNMSVCFCLQAKVVGAVSHQDSVQKPLLGEESNASEIAAAADVTDVADAYDAPSADQHTARDGRHQDSADPWGPDIDGRER